MLYSLDNVIRKKLEEAWKLDDAEVRMKKVEEQYKANQNKKPEKTYAEKMAEYNAKQDKEWLQHCDMFLFRQLFLVVVKIIFQMLNLILKKLFKIIYFKTT